MSPLAISVIKTLTFFDAQDLPLTISELRNFLIFEPGRHSPERFSVLEDVLEKELGTKVREKVGFYFLTGREALVKLRRKRFRLAVERYRKTRRFLFFLKFMPYVRGISLSGSLALLNADDDSDIDLFVIAKPGRIWLTRFFVSFYFQIFGQRRYQNYTKNRFCLNHYVVSKSQLREDHNLYSAMAYESLIPVLNAAELRLFRKNNSWTGNFLTLGFREQVGTYFNFRTGFIQKFLEQFMEICFFGFLLNNLLGLLQSWRIRALEYIYISDTQLSFHPDSKGRRILAKYEEKLSRVLP